MFLLFIAVEPVAVIVAGFGNQGSDLVVNILVEYVADINCSTTDPDFR